MMARLSGLLLLVACLATVHGATDSVGTQLKKLQVTRLSLWTASVSQCAAPTLRLTASLRYTACNAQRSVTS